MQLLIRASHTFALAFFVAVSATAFAHPGHEEGTGTQPVPLVAQPGMLAQAGPGAGPQRQPARTGTASKNEVRITVEGDYRIIRSNGWPDHAPGQFPRRGNPNTAAPQSYLFRVAVKPQLAPAPVQHGGWWWGIALNGVPFEPGTGETWNNDPQSGWRYEAATGFLDLGLDEHNAHVQPNGSYHYHALPNGLVARLGGDGTKMLQIGWAADGFPIYTAWAYSEKNDAKSALRKMTSSYRLKRGARPAQQGGPGGNYDGRFTQDFEFVKDSGDLDECNGRTGVTPEFPAGTYYYCVTGEFPFVSRMWRGVPDQSFSKGDRPPGGGPGQNQPGGAPRGGGMEGRPEGMAGGPGGPGSPVITALDLNRDGIIDAEELARAVTSLKALDKNGDGKLTPEEFRPFPPPGGPGGGGPPQGPGGQSPFPPR